jgi:hypothetical protein
MSAYSGPKIATTNAGQMVFSMDFSNRRTYSGSGTTVTNAVNNITGTLYNTPTFGSSRSRKFFSFNGTNQYIGFSNSTLLDTQTVSVAVWARTNNTTQDGFFFEKGAVNTQYSLFQAGANFVWRQYTTTLNSLTVTASNYVNTSNWFFIVGTFTSGDRRMYINGVQVASDTLAGTLATNASGMTIGSYNTGGYYYNGDIGLVRVYTKVLTSTEVRQNFNALRGRFGL